MEECNLKFYQQSWFIWIMLFLFFPVGLFLLWQYADYTTKSKGIITALILASVIWWVTSGSQA